MILNPRGIHFDSECWGIWVSTSKTTYSRCGVRLKCCGEPQGLLEHIELRFSGLSRCSEDWQAVILGPLLASWLLILLTKSIRLLFMGIFPASECAFLPMHNGTVSINPYGDNLCSGRLQFSYLSRAVRQRCGLMCYPDRQSPQAEYTTTITPIQCRSPRLDRFTWKTKQNKNPNQKGREQRNKALSKIFEFYPPHREMWKRGFWMTVGAANVLENLLYWR